METNEHGYGTDRVVQGDWYMANILHPRASGARHVTIEEAVVYADSPEEARMKVAKDLGRYRLDSKISLPVLLGRDQVWRRQLGTYVRSVEDDFRGRPVRDLLIELALELVEVENEPNR